MLIIAIIWLVVMLLILKIAGGITKLNQREDALFERWSRGRDQ